MGSGPSCGIARASSKAASVPRSRRPKRRGSRYLSCWPLSRSNTACVWSAKGVSGSTRRSWPLIPRWTTRTMSSRRPMRMYFPRRPTKVIRIPTIESTNTSGSGWRTMVGKRSSQRRNVRPTRCGRRSAAMVSTSGSSGTDDCQFLHVCPVGPDLGLDLDSRLQLIGACHDARHLLGELIDLRLGHLEQQLIVDLQQHPALYVVGLDLALQAHHRDLDDVCGQRLHRKVDGHPLGRAAQLKVRRAQVGDGAPPPRRADDEPLVSRLVPNLVQVLL